MRHTLKQWFSTGGALAPRRRLAVSGDIYTCPTEVSATGMKVVEAKDLAESLALHGTAPRNKRLPSPVCQ